MPIIKTFIVYRIFAPNAQLLYVGRTHLQQFPDRIRYHRGAHWGGDIARVTLDFLPDREASKDAERLAIRTEKPRYNYQALFPIGEAARAHGLPAYASAIEALRPDGYRPPPIPPGTVADF